MYCAAKEYDNLIYLRKYNLTMYENIHKPQPSCSRFQNAFFMFRNLRIEHNVPI